SLSMGGVSFPPPASGVFVCWAHAEGYAALFHPIKSRDPQLLRIPRLGKPLGVADGEVLNPAVAMMHEPLIPLLLPLAEGLLQGIESEIAPQGARHAPTHDPAAECIDPEGHVDEALPGGHIGQGRDPGPARP